MQHGAAPGQLTGEDEFLDLICSDDELVRAEFDAIVAEEWPDTSLEVPSDDRPLSAGRSARTARALHRQRRSARAQFAGVAAWARQRSPPDEAPA